MSRLVARILLTILLFPLASLFYFFVFLFCDLQIRSATSYTRTSTAMCFIVSGVVTWGAMALYWTLLWRLSVKWTGARIGRTLLAAAGAAAVASILATIVEATIEHEVGIFLGSAAAPLLWLAATVLIWRESDAERVARLKRMGTDTIVSPACGYNLTGLKEARCPECGAQYTLNELLAAQPQRAAVELDNG